MAQDEAVGVQARIARVYAEAILNVAGKENRADELGSELELVSAELKGNKVVEQFFAAGTISRAGKLPVLAAGFERGTSETFRKLIGVLNENNRLTLLPAIHAEYRKLQDVRSGRIRVTATSAVQLSDEQVDQLKTTLRTQLKAEPVLTIRNDADILGGLIVQVGDKVYDSSVRSRLENLRNTLLTSGTHG